MKLLLFDIDGTLLLSGGAGKRGMERAFESLFGVANALEGVPLAGMTDKLIFRKACAGTGVECTAENHTAFRERYVGFLEEEIEAPGEGKRLMPGIEPLLETLEADSSVRLGLLTGNYARGAEIKLGHFGLEHYFSFGAFGDDHEDRNELLPFATERYQNQSKQNGEPKEVWVIGDTPNDVACARPHNARAVAVATGGYSLDTLRKAEPDYLFADLSDPAPFLAAIES